MENLYGSESKPRLLQYSKLEKIPELWSLSIPFFVSTCVMDAVHLRNILLGTEPGSDQPYKILREYKAL